MYLLQWILSVSKPKTLDYFLSYQQLWMLILVIWSVMLFYLSLSKHTSLQSAGHVNWICKVKLHNIIHVIRYLPSNILKEGGRLFITSFYIFQRWSSTNGWRPPVILTPHTSIAIVLLNNGGFAFIFCPNKNLQLHKYQVWIVFHVTHCKLL